MAYYKFTGDNSNGWATSNLNHETEGGTFIDYHLEQWASLSNGLVTYLAGRNNWTSFRSGWDAYSHTHIQLNNAAVLDGSINTINRIGVHFAFDSVPGLELRNGTWNLSSSNNNTGNFSTYHFGSDASWSKSSSWSSHDYESRNTVWYSNEPGQEYFCWNLHQYSNETVSGAIIRLQNQSASRELNLMGDDWLILGNKFESYYLLNNYQFSDDQFGPYPLHAQEHPARAMKNGYIAGNVPWIGGSGAVLGTTGDTMLIRRDNTSYREHAGLEVEGKTYDGVGAYTFIRTS